MRRRRNPDALGDITTLAVLGVVGVVGYEVLVNQKTIGQAVRSVADGAANAVNSVSNAVSSAANATGIPQASSTVGNVANALTGNQPGMSDTICADINNWRANPPRLPGPLGTIFNIQAPFFDPLNWGAFHDYAVVTLGYDPGPTPPSCWYTAPTSPYGYGGPASTS